MTKYLLVYITAANKEEAGKIAETLVNEKYVACANYFPISSIYRWRGVVERATEYAIICKTREGNFNKLEKKVKELHSYETPAIIAVDIKKGSEEFLKWLGENSEVS